MLMRAREGEGVAIRLPASALQRMPFAGAKKPAASKARVNRGR